MRLAPVPRVRRDEFSPPRGGGAPVVVMDNVADWPALSWTADSLRAAAGNREVVVRETMGPPRNMFQNLAAGGRTTFGDYLDWVLATAPELAGVAPAGGGVRDVVRAVAGSGLEVSYYLDAKLDPLSADLSRDAPPPDWYARRPIDANLWCGVLGTSSGLHCDITPNCNVQVIGSKHVTLFAPSQSRRVYRIPEVTHCRFDPDDPDLDRFPLARGAAGLECTLRPGESLYIPVGWYHQVTVVSDWAVNVNFFWRRPFPQGLATPQLWRFLLRRGLARARARSTAP